MRRLEREKEQAARDANTAQEKAVTETLGRVLLGKAKLSKNTANAAASQQQLDVAFMQYTTLLSQTSALQRDWSTGQSVLAELNKLHGRDEQMIFTGIQTRKGMELYLDLLKQLSDTNTHKVSERQMSIAWNKHVTDLLGRTDDEKQKERIRLEYGYIGEKDAKRHAERLDIRIDQVDKLRSIGAHVMELAASQKEKRTQVAVMPRPTQQRTSMQTGSVGPGAQVYEPSTLRPPDRSDAMESEAGLTLEQTKNVCFKCFLLGGRSAEQCWLKDDRGERTPGHTAHKGGREIDCRLFDEKYPTTHEDRQSKIEGARKASRAAQAVCRRAIKKAKPVSNEAT